ncbi:MAG: HNH endonuclease [Bdellovibrionales bacterium]|nr:HNH endonuclease [Bdellovibrionales bacterium]
MNTIRALKDSELLSTTKALVQKERAVTMEVLRHLQEIERRKLYAFQFTSLFDYAVRELGYSEAAASRRIQAMRLMTEIPETAPTIESGTLNLSNICQAQSFFRDLQRAQPEMALSKEQKTEVLAQMEDKSAREGQKVILSICPPTVLPRERERVVSAEHIEVKFLIDQKLRESLEQVRALLGPKGAELSLAELVAEMARLSTERLSEKRFGKARVRGDADELVVSRKTSPNIARPGAGVGDPPAGTEPEALELSARKSAKQRTRYTSKAVKHRVWRAAGGKCAGCGSKHRLQFDHIQPFALRGDSAAENIQLLCSSCNIRRGIQSFGTRAMREEPEVRSLLRPRLRRR